MKTIIANIPAKTLTARNGQKFNNPARTATYTQDDQGKWRNVEFDMAVLEADVIDSCKQASNWDDIRVTHFPMYGFHN